MKSPLNRREFLSLSGIGVSLLAIPVVSPESGWFRLELLTSGLFHRSQLGSVRM